MLKKTPLHSVYAQITGVKLVDFGGWEMPVQFTNGILAEHHAVRHHVGLFDVSHMGEISIQGKDSGEFLDKLLTNRILNAEIGRCVYSPMCRDNAGTVDDLLVYVLDKDSYLLIVNASNTDKDFEWIQEQAKQLNFSSEIANVSADWAQLALQGPEAEALLSGFVKPFNLSSVEYYHHAGMVEVSGIQVLLSRTGYTGEDGFELYCSPKDATQLWDTLVSAGAIPCGLGARDLLRLESRLPLYGHELSDSISPLEAGLSMFVKFDKDSFVGRNALAQQKQDGIPRRIYGLEMTDAGVAREGYQVFEHQGSTRHEDAALGYITSGGRSPERESFIALALLRRNSVNIGDTVEVEIRGKRKRAKVVKTPFYKRPEKVSVSAGSKTN